MIDNNLGALIDVIHDKGVRMKYTERSHFKKAEMLKQKEKLFDRYLTIFILAVTAYSYVGLVYKIPLFFSVVAAASGTFAVVLSYKREAINFHDRQRRHRHAAENILGLVNRLRSLRLDIIYERIGVELALDKLNDIIGTYEAICASAPDLDIDIFDEVCKDFIERQTVTPEEIGVVFPKAYPPK